MNDSHIKVDLSKKQSLVDGNPSMQKQRQVDNVEELVLRVVLANQNGATPLGGITRTGLSL